MPGARLNKANGFRLELFRKTSLLRHRDPHPL
jgi:hypothetical protein